MPKSSLPVCCLALAFASCLAVPAWAQQGPGPQQVPWSVGGPPASHGGFDDDRDGSRNQAADAVRRAQAQSGGRVLGAERVQFDGRDIMRVKVLDESGRVRYMDDDPSTRSGQRRGSGSERNEVSSQRPRGPNP